MPRRKTNVADDLLLNKVVLRPERQHARFPEMLGKPFESFLVPGSINSQSVAGWYFPADAPTAPLALLNPSNRGTKADALDHVAVLLEAGCSILLYDYQGYGDSTGLADIRTLVADAQAVLTWAESRAIWSPREPLILIGLSLGTLVATRLAVLYRDSVKALILDGAVEPYRALRRSFGPLGAIVGEVACAQIPEDLNSEKQIQSVACPILFIHGKNDTIGTLDEARLLTSLAHNASLWVLDDCDHLDIITKHRDEYRDQLTRFLSPFIIP